MDVTKLESLNLGYVQELFLQYLNAPESVDPAWRAVFESAPEALTMQLPLLERPARERRERRRPRPRRSSSPGRGDELLLGAVAAAMALIKAHRMHGHLAATSTRSAASRPATPRSSPSA